MEVLLPAPAVRAHVQGRGQAHGGRDGVLVGRCGVTISAGVWEKVVQLLHVQVPLIRGELHEPDGVRGSTNWNLVNILMRGEFVSFEGFVRAYLPFLVIMSVGLYTIGWAFFL